MDHTLILSSEAARTVTCGNTTVVATPLDAITRLETRPLIARVVLAGAYARNDELAIFLCEQYPAVQLQHEA